MKERFLKIISHKAFVPVTVGVVSFGAGIGAGYILANRKGVYVEYLSDDLEEDDNPTVREIPLEQYLEEEKIVLGEKFIEERIIRSSSEEEPELIVMDEEPVSRSIFSGTDDEWDLETELASRKSDEPYIVHKDEFFADEEGFAQITLTYYSGDNILVDEEDTPIYNHETVVGELKFGHGSGDQNVVYVRNVKRRAEYEILYDPGMYSKEILGLDIEDNQRTQGLKHSTANRKFRMD